MSAAAIVGLVALLLLPGLPLAFHLERRVTPGASDGEPRDVLLLVTLAAGASFVIVPTLTFLTGVAGLPLPVRLRALLSCMILAAAGLVGILLDLRGRPRS